MYDVPTGPVDVVDPVFTPHISKDTMMKGQPEDQRDDYVLSLVRERLVKLTAEAEWIRRQWPELNLIGERPLLTENTDPDLGEIRVAQVRSSLAKRFEKRHPAAADPALRTDSLGGRIFAWLRQHGPADAATVGTALKLRPNQVYQAVYNANHRKSIPPVTVENGMYRANTLFKRLHDRVPESPGSTPARKKGHRAARRSYEDRRTSVITALASGPLTVRQISASLGQAPGNPSLLKLLNDLEREGLISRARGTGRTPGVWTLTDRGAARETAADRENGLDDGTV